MQKPLHKAKNTQKFFRETSVSEKFCVSLYAVCLPGALSPSILSFSARPTRAYARVARQDGLSSNAHLLIGTNYVEEERTYRRNYMFPKI